MIDNNKRINGIVLSSMPIGEYDKRVVILTREMGKISAFARGARRPGSGLLSASQPFSCGSFMIYEGKSSNSISSAHLSVSFDDIVSDLKNVWYGSYFLEVCDHFAREGLDEEERLQLLYYSLRALQSGRFEADFVRKVFDIRTMKVNGVYPDIFAGEKTAADLGMSETAL